MYGADLCLNSLRLADSFRRRNLLETVHFVQMNLFRPVFQDASFDMVISNGVLHHTENAARGLRELVRVMKHHGRGWLYLYARPGGLDRLTHYLARLLLKDAAPEVCRRYCRALDLPGHRTFFLLDLWLTPVAECYTPGEVAALLAEIGCGAWRRLTRGADQDAIEQIHCRPRAARTRFGLGENRYLFSGKRS